MVTFINHLFRDFIGFVFVLIYSFRFESFLYLQNISAAFIGLISFLLIAKAGKLIFKKPSLGIGDAKLCFLIGLWLGFEGLFITIYLSFILSGLFCAVLLLLKKIDRHSKIPFGPFLIISMLSVWYLGINFFKSFYNL